MISIRIPMPILDWPRLKVIKKYELHLTIEN